MQNMPIFHSLRALYTFTNGIIYALPRRFSPVFALFSVFMGIYAPRIIRAIYRHFYALQRSRPVQNAKSDPPATHTRAGKSLKSLKSLTIQSRKSLESRFLPKVESR